MGCLKLHIDQEPRLIVAYSKKGQKLLKNTLSYYPFGIVQKGYNNTITSNANSMAERFAFGGKELGEELGLDWYDVQARNYDPALGRWMNLDPLAEKMRRHSPYNFAFDNPIYFIDPDGMMPQGSQGPCGDKPCPDPPKEGGMTFMDILNSIDLGFTFGAGETFGLSGKIFGFELGGKTDKGTTAVSGSLKDGVSTEATEGYSANFFIFGYSNETSTDLSNPSKSLTGNDDGIPTVNEQSFETTQTNTETFTFLFADASIENTTNGEANIEATSTPVTDFSAPMQNFSKVASQTSFLPTGESTPESSNGGQINIIGFEINAGFRLGVDIHIDVPENYKSKRNPLNSLCFVKGTKILMFDSSQKSIEDVKVGDLVRTFNEKTKKLESKKVLRIDSPFHENLIQVSFNNNIFNVNTQDHPYFVVGKGWCSYDPSATKDKYNMNVERLSVGDICLFINEKGDISQIEVVEIEITDRAERTYNLSGIEDNHNFFANGVLVHNKLQE